VVSFEISSHSHALLSQEGSAIEDGASGGSEGKHAGCCLGTPTRAISTTSHRAVPLTQGDVAAHQSSKDPTTVCGFLSYGPCFLWHDIASDSPVHDAQPLI
jgi:hypothetical protein